MEIKIQEENLRKAHSEGCSDVKRVLETLAPEVFQEKYPCLKKYQCRDSMHSGLIVLFESPRTGYVVKSVNCIDPLGRHSCTWVEEYFHPIKGIQEVV